MSSIAIHRVHDIDESGEPLFHEMQKMLDLVQQRAFELFQRRGAMPGTELDDWFRAEREVLGAPRSELTESARDYVLRIAVPGLEAKDLKITSTPRSITVRGDAVHRHAGGEHRLCFCEFGERLLRRFDLPEPIDPDRVSAALDKGILRIVAAKDHKHREMRNIPVSTQPHSGAGA
jgi:HSP20 family molecular chaperone IbpA